MQHLPVCPPARPHQRASAAFASPRPQQQLDLQSFPAPAVRGPAPTVDSVIIKAAESALVAEEERVAVVLLADMFPLLPWAAIRRALTAVRPAPIFLSATAVSPRLELADLTVPILLQAGGAVQPAAAALLLEPHSQAPPLEERQPGAPHEQVAQLEGVFAHFGRKSVADVWAAAPDFELALASLFELSRRAEEVGLPPGQFLILFGQQLRPETESQSSDSSGSAALAAGVKGTLFSSRSTRQIDPAEADARSSPAAVGAGRTTGGWSPDGPTKMEAHEGETVMLDLHGWTVKQAVAAVEEAVAGLRGAGPAAPTGLRTWRKLVVVTGRGSHSAGSGRAPVRRAVVQLLDASKLRYSELHGGGALEVKVPAT